MYVVMHANANVPGVLQILGHVK